MYQSVQDIAKFSKTQVTLKNHKILKSRNKIMNTAAVTATITVGSHSQTTTVDSQESILLKPTSKVYVDVECKTTDGVFLSCEEYDKLLKQASLCPDFKNSLNNIRSLLQNLEKPEMDPEGFQKICRDSGAENLYFCVYDAICTEQMSDERKNLVKVRTMYR